MKYIIPKVGEPGAIHIEEADVLEVKAGRDCVEVSVANRPVYREEESFLWQGARQPLLLRLTTRQAADLVRQDREGQAVYCSPCYDFGKSADPEDCTRCRVIAAHEKAGLGDLRRRKGPAGESRTEEGAPPWGYLAALAACAVVVLASLQIASSAVIRTYELEQQLRTCRNTK